MTPPVWLCGEPDFQRRADGGSPILWHGSLEAPASTGLLSRAAAEPEDLLDFASRPGAELRILRRRLTRLLLSQLADVHPARVRFRRTGLGAVDIVEPAGWYVSVAGRGAQFLIGAARASIGVDLEILVDEPLPPDQISDLERLHLAQASHRDWTLCWAAKEAHSKRLGIASAVDPASITALPAAAGTWNVRTGGAESVCHFQQAGDTVLAVAVGISSA